MRVFIDTMIYIKYLYAELAELKILQKIERLIDEEKIKLVFPEITFDEVYRNSIEKICYYKKKIVPPSLISNLPPSVLGRKTYLEAKKLVAELDSKMLEIKNEYQKIMDMLMETIERLELKAERITEHETIVEKARIRRLLGRLPYPTETNDGLGDGIAWELLFSINDTEKTIIIY